MSSNNIEVDEDSASIEVVGSNAREQMKRILNAIEPGLDGEIERMHVEIETDGVEETPALTDGTDADEEGDEEGNERSPPAPDAGGGAAGKMNKVPDRGSRSDAGTVKAPLVERDRNAEPTEIRAGTSHHVVLDEVDEMGDATSVELGERLGPMPQGTIDGALTTLFVRRLLDREKETQDSGGHIMRYNPTEAGEEMLDELGPASLEEWAGEE